MNRSEVVIIAAIAKSNRVIGDRGLLPWSLPEDLKRFRELTWNHPIIVGRKTWEFGLKGRSLPHRHTIVVSTRYSSSPPQSEGDASTSRCIVPSIDAALQQAQLAPRVFIIGGASIYAQTLELADRLELTLVEGHFNGDAFFPDYRPLVQQHFKQIHQAVYDGFRTESYQAIRSHRAP